MASAGPGPAAAFPEILNLVGIRGLERWCQPENDTSEYRDQESEEEHAGADANLIEPWDVRGGKA